MKFLRAVDYSLGWIASLMGAPPPKLQAAALAYRVEEDGALQFLLITSRRTKRWILPKGGIEKGEGTAEAAQREAFEEAGVVGQIHKEPLGIYDGRKYLGAGATRRMRIVVHALQVERLAEDYPEAGQRQVRWMSPDEAATAVDESQLAALIHDAAQKLLD
ncbi:NUDIX hydrolase [Notoacmeibacter ruber]|uniref:NUDIX domain-containing protein n=1 Tax=Notoacmeibacter ruber TaxID=2670375 RepID=A0A3L7JC38_9HYPH|nr:NUDIX hydrolase [Notoacmeibacter ruber]RLQ88040.1 NUDIX domain-containing protein [Notoacmeibacter ruber]